MAERCVMWRWGACHTRRVHRIWILVQLKLTEYSKNIMTFLSFVEWYGSFTKSTYDISALLSISHPGIFFLLHIWIFFLLDHDLSVNLLPCNVHLLPSTFFLLQSSAVALLGTPPLDAHKGQESKVRTNFQLDNRRGDELRKCAI